MPEHYLYENNIELDKRPNDVLPPNDRKDIVNLDEDRLKDYLLAKFQDLIRDKIDLDWVSRRTYDIDSYYSVKDELLAQDPWPNACNHRTALTPTLLDTAHANIKSSIWMRPENPVRVKGIGMEDIRKAPILSSLLNHQAVNEIDMQAVQDANIFRTFLHGTGILKILRDFNNNIKCSSLDIENCFARLDAKGLQAKDTDIFIQAVPLTWTDLQYRKQIYRDTSKIMPGAGFGNYNTQDQIKHALDNASGTNFQQLQRRELYYILECYLTYFEKDSIRPRELIVWISPNGGTIQRIRENEEGIRPFADYHAYPVPDRFFSVSLPERIRNEQEELDYAYKQNTDANDVAIRPAMFAESTEDFDASRSQRVPGGIYKVGRNNRLSFEPQPPVDRGFERSMLWLWDQAERKLGLYDIQQGRASSVGRTLGETQIRMNRGDIRFKTLFDRFERGWKKTWDIIYRYDNMYMPRDKKLKIIGFEDFVTVDEIFPSEGGQRYGLQIDGSFDFGFTSSAITDEENERENAILLYQELAPTVTDKGDLWRLQERLAEARGIRDFGNIFRKPREAKIIDASEFIQRVVSGQHSLQIRPGIDTDDYIFEIEMFMRTETFLSLDSRGQKALADALRRSFVMAEAERLALLQVSNIRALQGAGAAQLAALPNEQPIR